MTKLEHTTNMTPEQAQDLIGNFYLTRDADKVPEAILSLGEAGCIHGQPVISWWNAFNIRFRKSGHLSVNQWSQKSDYALITFLANVLRQEQANPEAWYEKFKTLRKDQLRSIWLAYWHSGSVRAIRVLQSVLESERSRDRIFLDHLSRLTPVSFLEMPLVGPGTLDIWWACFSATGELNAVTNVVNALGLVAEKEGSPPHSIGVSALWSLKSHAKSHQIVAEHVQSILKEVTDEGMRIMLQGVLTDEPST